MFHHTHSYLASKIYKSESSLLMLGSFIPDIAATKLIPWQDGGLHGKKEVKQFKEFTDQNYPNYKDLTNGIKAHNIVDDLSHIEYKDQKPGYSFQNNKKLVNLVEEYYGFKGNEAESCAHTFIETAVDIHLLKNVPEVQDKLKFAINQIDRQKISTILAKYFSLKESETLPVLNDFLDLFTKYDFSQKAEWIIFWGKLDIMMRTKKLTDDQYKSLIDQALKTTSNTFQEFLDYAAT